MVQVLLLFLLAGPSAPGAEGAEAVRAELERARQTHFAALEKAREELLRALGGQIEAARRSGENELAELLAKEEEEFRSQGALPVSKQLLSAVAAYRRTVKAAGASLFLAYEKAISEYTRLKDLEKAESAHRELEELKENETSLFDRQKKEAVGSTLERSREEHQVSEAKARRELLAALDQAMEAAVEKGDFPRVQAVRAARKALEEEGKLPGNVTPAVKAAVSRYERALEAAHRKMNEGFSAALRQARAAGDTQAAAEVLARKLAFAEEHRLRLNQRIPRDAVFFQGHAYKVFDRAGWEEARAACEKLGGHLAAIGSEEENAFLLRLAGGLKEEEVWIGLHDTGLAAGKKTRQWVWTTGEPVAYKNWDRGQPNNRGLEFMAAFRKNGKWHDWDRGRHLFPFFCEWVNLESEFLRG